MMNTYLRHVRFVFFSINGQFVLLDSFYDIQNTAPKKFLNDIYSSSVNSVSKPTNILKCYVTGTFIPIL
jgi:hypothetical protein